MFELIAMIDRRSHVRRATSARRRSTRFGAAISVIALAVAACGGSDGSDTVAGDAPAETAGGTDSAGSAETGGGVLQVAVSADPETIDPHIGANTVHSVWMALVYETLVALDSDGEPVPGIAESWSVSDDGLVYSFVLRDDVTFHNGRQLVAEDVKFNYERIIDPDTGATQSGQLTQITEIRTPDERTVELVLAAPNSAILSELAVQGRVGLAAPEAFDDAGEMTAAIGTGPFEIDPSGYVVNDRLAMTANDTYWDDRAIIDGIELSVVADPLARVIAVSEGDVDLAWDVPGVQATTEADAGNLQIQPIVTNEANWLSLDSRNPKLADERVRRALLMAVSRNDITAAGWDGFATPVYQPFIEDSVWNVDIPSQSDEADVDAARALLAEAGVGDGELSMSLLSWADAGTQREAEVIASAWSQIGVPTTVESVDTATMIDRATTGEYDALSAFVAFVLDPNRPYNYFNKDWNLNGLAGSIQSDELTDLFLEGQQTIEPDARREVYSDLVNAMYENEPSFMYTVRKSSFLALGNDVEGYTQGNLLAVHYAGDGGILDLTLAGDG